MTPEKLKLISASVIGESLVKKDFLNKSSVETNYGSLIPIRKIDTNSTLPEKYQNKKVMFWLGESAVVIHYWGENYVEDPLYFRNLYQNSKEIYINELIPTPDLIDFDDKNMTLVIKRAENDLSIYLSSKKENEINFILDKSFNLFRSVWEKSKEEKMGFPRYVSSFLQPEYPFLKSRKIDDYLSRDLMKTYKSVQNELTNYLDEVKKENFENGFGFADVKLDNLVEDKDKILFIDVEKPEKVNWLTLVGQLYQDAVSKGNNSLFTKMLKEKSEKIFNKEKKQKLAVCHFNLGRMNRLLLPYTLRNISYNVETNNKIDFDRLNKSLKEVQTLLHLS